MKVSVILPTYNEKGNIIKLIEQLIKEITKAKHTPHIVVVDDDSPDGTAGEVKKKFSRNSTVSLYVRKKEKGLASAIHHGIHKVGSGIVVIMDTDFNHDPKLIPTMIRKLKSTDVVIGSRFIRGGGMDNRSRNLLSYIFNVFFLKPLLGSPVRDNLSGFFAIKLSKLKKLPQKKIFYGYGDYFFRLIRAAKKRNYSFSEAPSFYKERTYGESKSKLFSMAWSYTVEVIKCRITI